MKAVFVVTVISTVVFGIGTIDEKVRTEKKIYAACFIGSLAAMVITNIVNMIM